MQNDEVRIQNENSLDRRHSSFCILCSEFCISKLDLIPILLATTIFSALSIWAARVSDGFLEADACTHFMYSRFALSEPHYFLNVWGRPFVTALYALPAAFGGRAAVRMTTLVVALFIAFVAYRIAKNQKYRWPALAFVFTLAQPLVFLHSFAELTELPFALLVGLAFWAYQKRQWFLMAIVASLAPTARPEGFAVVAFAALAILAHRRWWWIFVLPLPLLVWQLIAWNLYGRPTYDDPIAQFVPHALHWLLWLKHEWPYAAKSLYASGSIFQFIALLPAVVGPAVFPALLLGAWRSFRERDLFRDYRARCQFLIAAIPFFFLVAHSILYFTGRMASSGELRYMLIGAPFWALLIAKGWEWFFERLNFRWPLAWAALASLVPIAIHYTYPVLPLTFYRDWQQARSIAKWYRGSEVAREYPMLLTSHPGVPYFMDVSFTNSKVLRDFDKKTVNSAPPGTLLIWEKDYGTHNASADRSIDLPEIRAAGWIEDDEATLNILPDDYEMHWRIFRSPQPAPTTQADRK